MQPRKYLDPIFGSLLLLLLVVAPFALALSKAGERAIFGTLASDAMYYLAVAKNTVAHGFFTFNQETATNGFQPLWQYLLTLLNGLLKPSLENQLYLGFGLSLLLVAVGLAAAVRGVDIYFGRRLGLAIPFFLLPGAFALLFEPARGHYSPDPAFQYSFSSWAFANGMESGLTVAAFGLFLMTVLRRLAAVRVDATSAEIFSFWPRVWLALLALARLDDLFVGVGVGCAVLLFDPGAMRHRIRNAALILTPTVGLLLLYMIYNKATVGFWLPVSGLRKVEFALQENTSYALEAVFGYSVAVASRLLPILVFLVSGLAVLGYVRFAARARSAEGEPSERSLNAFLLTPLAVYLFLKACFLSSAVELFLQGWWFYSGQIFVFNLLVAVGLLRLLATRVAAYRLAVATALLVTFVQLLDAGHRIAVLEGYVKTYSDIWGHRDSIVASLTAIDPEMKVIDNADGLYGFILPMPVASATGLVFSHSEWREAAEKGKVRALIDRGYNVLPVSPGAFWEGHYLKVKDLDAGARLLYVSRETGIRFYRLWNRGG